MNTKECSSVLIQHSQSRVHSNHISSYTTSILTSLDLKRLKRYTLQITKISITHPITKLITSDLPNLESTDLEIDFKSKSFRFQFFKDLLDSSSN